MKKASAEPGSSDANRHPRIRPIAAIWSTLLTLVALGYIVPALALIYEGKDAGIGVALLVIVVLSLTLAIRIALGSRGAPSPPEGTGSTMGRSRRRLILSWVAMIAVVAGFLSYVLGWYGAGRSSVLQGKDAIVNKLLESKCEVVGTPTFTGYGLIDFSVYVSAQLRNKTSETLKVWVKAEVMSGDKVLLGKSQQVFIAAREIKDVRIAFDEAERDDWELYKGCRVLVERVE